jgi:hypothetical protein
MRQLPFLIVGIIGVFMAIQFFVPHQTSVELYTFLTDTTQIISVFTLVVGISSLVRVNMTRIERRSLNWQYSIVTIVGLFLMLVVGFFSKEWIFTYNSPAGLQNPIFKHVFDYIITPIQASVFATLAFYVGSASYRAFRARSVLASLLLGAALIVMLRFAPLGLGSYVYDTATWLMNVPNLAAQRAIVIGVGIGIVATALKVVLGIERGYLGRG